MKFLGSFRMQTLFFLPRNHGNIFANPLEILTRNLKNATSIHAGLFGVSDIDDYVLVNWGLQEL